jgi:nitroreductase
MITHKLLPEDAPSEKFSNAVIQNIYSRRSNRNYKPDPVPDEVLLELINAGIYAPTAKNQQLWRFAVVTDRSTIDRYADLAKQLCLKNLPSIAATPGLTAEQVSMFEKMMRSPIHIFHHAPALVFIFAPQVPFIEQDCACAAENMMLAAHSLGLGSCWIGTAVLPLGAHDQTLEELKVPKGYRIMAAVVFGYPTNEAHKAPARNKDVIISWTP